ncbi:MAG: rhamnogalacturonan acetylesterase [Spirochaetaceae bacterium]|nr:MAG: rhamnogalacturonan acetylesterase [Spirochaetaceae bacterium]
MNEQSISVFCLCCAVMAVSSLSSCAGGPASLSFFTEKPATIENARALLATADYHKGLAMTGELLVNGKNDPEVMKLWQETAEAKLELLEAELSFDLYSNNAAEKKLYAEQVAARDFLIDSAAKGGFLIKRIWLVGDSTMADYRSNTNPGRSLNPMTGWGEMFQEFFTQQNLSAVQNLVKSDSLIVVNKGMGGRSTRTYWNEGSWKKISVRLRPGDLVMIQFGHNDSATDRAERFVDVPGYRKFLSMFIEDAMSKKAIPILLTPVNRNYPWSAEGKISNCHGDYTQAMRDVAQEMKTPLIDVNQRSLDLFNARGRQYVTSKYFMVFGPEAYPQRFPKGNDDNTHFQPEGAGAVANMVWEGLLDLAGKK